MRGLGLFIGSNKRNDPIKLVNPRPQHDLGDAVHTGDAGLDGYTRVSIANPDRSGNMPQISGTEGYCYWGPDESWEQ